MSRPSGSRPKTKKGFFKKNNTYASKKRRLEAEKESVDLVSSVASSSTIASSSNNTETENVDLVIPQTPEQNPQPLEKTSSSRSKINLQGLYGRSSNVSSRDSNCETLVID